MPPYAHPIKWSVVKTVPLAIRGVVLAIALTHISSQAASAQVIPDTSLGANPSVVVTESATQNRIEGGFQQNTALFHSFQDFNIDTGNSVYFVNPTDIETIFTRVTGTTLSQLDGTLGVLGNADLFLLNPNGVIFGPGAQLDLNGSFIASTADSIVFTSETEFSAINPEIPLLTVNIPSGLQYGATPGNIINQSTVENSNNTTGLTVQPGNTLALIGGELSLLDSGENTQTGSLMAPAGRIELGSVASEGLINLTPTVDGYTFDYDKITQFGDITFSPGALVFTRGEGGGAIQVQGQVVTLNDDVSISADTLSSQPGGDIVIQANELLLEGRAQITSEVYDTGPGGTITLQVDTLLVQDNALIASGIFGDGDGGQLTIDADFIEVSGFGLLTQSENGSTGNVADLVINTRELVTLDGAEISASTFGDGNGGHLIINATESVQTIGANGNGGLFAQASRGATGNAGQLTINTQQIILEDDAQISTSTQGDGSAGPLTLNATDLIAVSEGGIFTQANSNTTGTPGELTINTARLLLEDGAQASASSFGAASGGTLTVNATESIHLIGESPDGRFPTGLLNRIDRDSTGKQGGDLTVQTRQLVVQDGATISASTFGAGDGGVVTINATESVLVTGTSPLGEPSNINTQSNLASSGNAGDLTINTHTLSIQGGGFISSRTLGEGDSGTIMIDAAESVQITGLSNIGQFLSRLLSETLGSGNAEDIIINTNRLEVSDRGVISAATSGGSGGTIAVTAQELLAGNGGQLRTQTLGESNAGDIFLTVTDFITLTGKESGLFAGTTAQATGNGGSIFIDPHQVTIENEARIAVDSQGTGTGGNIQLIADRLFLRDNALISAETTSSKGGDIALLIKDVVLLRNSSNISATAGINEADGDGGNVIIDTNFLVSPLDEDNNITANAFLGQGGNVQITAAGIYGIEFQFDAIPVRNDITASSAFGVAGEVDIDTLALDPTRGTSELPAETGISTISQRCNPSQGISNFVATGRGGLPLGPEDAIASQDLWEELYSPTDQTIANIDSPALAVSIPSEPLIEAQTWEVNNEGNIVLTTEPNQTSPHHVATAQTC